MEPIENKEPKRRPGRPANRTPEDMAKRARLVRFELMLGRGIREICALNGLTISECRSAIRWLGKWKDNSEAFGEFRAGEQNRLEAIQKRIDAVNADSASSETEKAHAIVRLHKLAHDIRFNIMEIGLPLGLLDREEPEVKENYSVSVYFGDERVEPWFAKKEEPKLSSEKVN